MLNVSAAQAVPSLRFEMPTQVPALRCWMSLQCALLKDVWQCAVVEWDADQACVAWLAQHDAQPVRVLEVVIPPSDGQAGYSDTVSGSAF